MISPSVVVANRSGGALKTTLAVNLAGLAASKGARVLLVDMDPQNDCALHLGLPLMMGHETVDAITRGSEPMVVREPRGRRGLDFIAGGDALDEAVAVAGRNTNPVQWLAEKLEGMITRATDPKRPYDLVVFDTPPGDVAITKACLAVASSLLIPVRTTPKYMASIPKLAGLVRDARVVNPGLQVAGVVMTGVPGPKLLRIATRKVQAVLGDTEIPIFQHHLRISNTAGAFSEENGVLVHEIPAQLVSQAKRRFEELREARKRKGEGSGETNTVQADREEEIDVSNADDLLDDYMAILGEVFQRLALLHASERS